MKNPSAFPTGLKGKCVLEGGRYDGAHVPEYDEEPVANNACKMADAMLKEREREE